MTLDEAIAVLEWASKRTDGMSASVNKECAELLLSIIDERCSTCGDRLEIKCPNCEGEDAA